MLDPDPDLILPAKGCEGAGKLSCLAGGGPPEANRDGGYGELGMPPELPSRGGGRRNAAAEIVFAPGGGADAPGETGGPTLFTEELDLLNGPTPRPSRGERPEVGSPPLSLLLDLSRSWDRWRGRLI